jgi:hypothetical protein
MTGAARPAAATRARREEGAVPRQAGAVDHPGRTSRKSALIGGKVQQRLVIGYEPAIAHIPGADLPEFRGLIFIHYDASKEKRI